MTGQTVLWAVICGAGVWAFLCLAACFAEPAETEGLGRARPAAGKRATTVSIQGERFYVNGQPTYPGRSYKGQAIEGLLLNARLVQGIFDDLNEATRARWAYPDGPWDPQRNTREFVAAMPAWREAGLIGLTINLQGGSPEGYSKAHPWHNSAYRADGSLRPAYMDRLESILDQADRLGMAAIVGLFYFGQVGRLKGEQAVIQAADNATDWLIEKGYANVLVEIANEANHAGYPPIIHPDRAGELIGQVRRRSEGKVASPTGRLLVSTSLTGGAIPPANLVEAADFLLLHGNGVDAPAEIGQMVRRCREIAAYRGQPILFNEDDHFDFDQPANNMLAAIQAGAGWGYFDYRMKGEGFAEGYQSVPVDWRIRSARKKAFFAFLAEVTGQPPRGELQ